MNSLSDKYMFSHTDGSGTSGEIIDMIREDFFRAYLRLVDFLYHLGEFFVGGIGSGRDQDDFVNAAWQDIQI